MFSGPGLSVGDGLAVAVAIGVALGVGAGGLGLATVIGGAGAQPSVRASPVANASRRIRMRVCRRTRRQLSTVTMCAWILPSMAPRPNRCATASAATSVASASRDASRASISFRSGVPSQ